MRGRRELGVAAVALAGSIVLVAAVDLGRGNTGWGGPRLWDALGYAAAWFPLAVAVFVARSPRAPWFRPIDVLWGAAAGLIARALTSLIAPSGTPLGAAFGLDAWAVFTLIAAPLVLAPIVEELFFRGLVLRAVLAGSRRTGRRVLAVAVSAALFGLMHALWAPGAEAVTFAATAAFGVCAGAVAAWTGRVGGAVVAHAVFNATVVGLVFLG